MRTSLLSLLIFVCIFHNIYTQELTKEDFEFGLNYGSFGGGMNVFPNKHNFEFSASLVNFFMEHDRTNIGLEITPLKYIANYSINTRRWDQSLYFLNGNLYWNPFDIKNIILGPFVSMSYLSIENWTKFNTSGYIFNSGLRFLLTTYIKDWERPFHIIGSEIGYRNITGSHSFYFSVNFDITILAGLIVSSLSTEANEVVEANEDYERQISGTGPFVPKEPKQPKPPFQEDKDIK
jgi:hypothetical protein